MDVVEEYRPILFFLSWFLVLEIFSIILAFSTGYYVVIPFLTVLFILTLLIFLYVVYKARKAVLERL